MCGLTNVGLKKRFAYAFSLCALAMVWLCFISPPEAVSGGKDWFGRVIVWETRSAEYGGSKEEPDAKSSGECSDKLEAIAVLQYCSGRFYLEDVRYIDVHKCSANGTHRMKHCSRAPMESWDCRDLFITRNNKEEGRKFGDTLNVGSDGTYILRVSGNINGTNYTFLNSTGNKNCAGERRNLKTVTVPYEGAKVGDVLSPREVEAWEPVLAAAFRPNEPGTTIVKPLVGQVWSISFDANGRVSREKRNVIQYNTKLPLLKGGGTEPCHICSPAVKKIDKNNIIPAKKRANWFFTTDPCEYVKKELEDAVEIKETYDKMSKDPKTANMGGKAFNDSVEGKLVSDGLAPSAPMKTNKNSCTPPEDAAETKKKYYMCLPEIVFEADLAHEKVHQDTCGKLNVKEGVNVKNPYAYENFLEDKKNYADEEIKAYNEKIKVLQNWLDKNCKN